MRLLVLLILLNSFLLDSDIPFCGTNRLCAQTVKVTDSNYIKLRRNKPFDEQVTRPGMIYEICYDYNLNGGTVKIPVGCVLKFNGGRLKNGVLIGQGTKLSDTKNIIFDQIVFKGKWDVPVIRSSMFFDLSGDNALSNIFNLTDEDVNNLVIIDKSKYDYSICFTKLYQSVINVCSNTKIVINGCIRVKGNDLNGYRVFYGNEKHNISFEGNGLLIGDFYDENENHPITGKHDLTGVQMYEGKELRSHEYCHGLCFYNSNNISITGLTICRFPGDAISLSNTGRNNINNNHFVCGCELYKCRRQGISVIGNNIVITNNYIHDIKGTNPQSAIDIEPNNSICSCSNVVIDNNKIENCFRGVLLISSAGSVSNIRISNNKAKVIQEFSYTSGKSVSNVEVYNNEIDSDNRGLMYVNTNRCTVSNNTIHAKGCALYNNPGNNLMNFENNRIYSKESCLLISKNSVFTNNLFAFDSALESMTLSLSNNENVVFKQNTIINGYIGVSGKNLEIVDNDIECELSPKTSALIRVNNLIFDNNTYTIKDSNLKNTFIVSFDETSHAEVSNNSFIIKGNKMEPVVEIRENSTGINLKNNNFQGDFQKGTISNLSKGDVSIEHPIISL